MNGDQDIPIDEITREISKTFAMQGTNTIIHTGERATLEELRNYLTGKISELIDNNFNFLINTLYRIDIGEEKLHALFASDKRGDIPKVLADLIIERQLQKIYFRNKYKKGEI